MGRKWWIVVGLVIAGLFWKPASQEKNTPKPAPLPSQTQASEATAAPELEFPVVVSGTGLIVQCAAQYEGPFLESEEQEPVSGVMALMVYNPGSQFVRRVQLQLQQGQRVLGFEITMLPPGGRVLVLEENGEAYAETPVSQCACLSLELGEWDTPGITVSEADGRLMITNQTAMPLEQVRLHFKQYYGAEEFCLGGRTGEWNIGRLEPGQSREVVPYGYVSGHSRILGVTAAE